MVVKHTAMCSCWRRASESVVTASSNSKSCMESAIGSISGLEATEAMLGIYCDWIHHANDRNERKARPEVRKGRRFTAV